MSDKKAQKTAQELYIDLLKEVKSITKPTPEQAELLRLDALYNAKKLTWEDKEFDIYRKAVRAAFRAEKAMQSVKNLNAGKAAKRTNMLCQLGGLVVLAGLEDVDRGAILGALLTFKAEPARTAEYKKKGDLLLSQREAAKKKSPPAPTATDVEVLV